MTNDGELVAELSECYRQIEEIKHDAEDLITGLSEIQFNWRPAPSRWSIGECLEHLNVTARLYWPIVTEAIMHSRSTGVMSPGPFKHGWFGNVFVRSAEPPVKSRYKSPRKFRPLADQPISRVWPQFITFQDRMLEMLQEANGVDLARTKVQSPALKLLKLTLGQAFRLITAHERRHLWQAREVKNDPNFPKDGSRA